MLQIVPMILLWLAPVAPEHNNVRELVRDACTACHTLDRVKTQRLTRDEWRQTIGGMLSEGVPLTDDELTLVVDYLARNFGPERAQP